MTSPDSTDQTLRTGCLVLVGVICLPLLPLLIFGLIYGLLALSSATSTFLIRDQIPGGWDARLARAAQRAIQTAREDDSFNGAYQVFPQYQAYRIEDYRSRPVSLTLCDNTSGGPGWGQLEVFAFKIQQPRNTPERWVCVRAGP